MAWSSIAPILAEVQINGEMSRPSQSSTALPNTSSKPIVSKDSIDISLGLEHPLLEMIRNADELPPIDDRFAGETATLDKDPYFLRSQSWSDSKNEKLESGSLETSFDRNSVTIKVEELSGSSRALTIHQPLKALHVTDDYVLLSSQTESFFSDRSLALKDEPLEGVFVLKRDDLTTRALTAAAVPLYFLPLPGLGWTGDVAVTDLPTLNAVAIHNSAESDVFIPVTHDDIQTVVYGQSINLQLAMLMAMRVAREKPGSLLEEGVFPVSGSTAGFGLYFTGQNLANPGQDFYSFQNIDAATKTSTGSHTWIPKALREAFGIQSTYAQTREATPEELEMLRKSNEALFWRGVRVFSILGFSFGLSVLLRHTVYREHFKQQRIDAANRPAKDPAEEKGFWQKTWGSIKRNSPEPVKKTAVLGREYLDVYAHSMTLLYQFVGGTTGNVVEVIFDSLLPKYAAADKTVVRRFLNKTFLFSRNALKNVPVNWDTWVKGTLVIGGMDTALVGLQVYWVVPAMAQGIAEVVPSLNERVDRVYDLHNPLLDSYNQNEVIRNGIAYATAGAASYSGELRSQLELMLGSEVDRELQRSGVNVLSEEGKAKRDEILKQRVDVYMQKMGLPGKEAFLFDFYTVYKANQKMSGYLADGAEFQVTPAAGEQKAFQFMGENRPGLVRSALKAAVRDVKARLKSNPSDVSAQQALPVLQDMVSESGHLAFNLAFGLPHQIQNIRKMRQSLVTLTYAGKFGEDLKLLPSYFFQRFGEAGTRAASIYYRRAFYSLIEGYSELRSAPSESANQKYGADAYKRALADVRKSHPEDKTPDSDFVAKFGSEVGMLTELYIHQASYDAEQDAKLYEPTSDGVFSRLQRKSITQRALAAMKAEGVTFDAKNASVGDRLRFYKAYRDALLTFFRISPDYSANEGLRASVAETAQHLNDKVLAEHKFQRYLNTLEPLQREVLIAEAMALNEATVYTDLTLRGSSVHPLDPAQPGFLQKWRQGESRRAEFKDTDSWKIKTRLARLYEASLASGEYQMGLKPWIFRNVPFAFDTYSSFQRTIMLIPSYMSTSFVWNKLFWGQTISYPMWFFFVLMLPSIIAPKQFCNRIFEYQRWQPMGSLPMTVLFGFVYSWFTFGGSFPLQLYAEDFVASSGKIAIGLGGLGLASLGLLVTKQGKWVQDKIGRITEPALEAGINLTSKAWNSNFCRLLTGRLKASSGQGLPEPLGAPRRSQ